MSVAESPSSGMEGGGGGAKTPSRWTEIPLRFEILAKKTRIVVETPRAQ